MKTRNITIFVAILITSVLLVSIIKDNLGNNISNDSDVKMSNKEQNTNTYSSLIEDNYEIVNDQEEGLVFINSLYDYKVTFPNNWNVNKIVGQIDQVGFYDPVAQKQKVDTELLQGMKIEIVTDEVNSSLTFDKLVDSKLSWFSADELLSQKDVIVDNQKAVEAEINSLGYNITTFVKNNSQLYSIVGYIGDVNEKEKYIKIYRSILSTFEFIK